MIVRRVPVPAARALAGALAAALTVAMATAPSSVGAQPRRPATRRDTSTAPALPRDVAREVVDQYNESATRVAGPYTLPAGGTVEGDLAVLTGPVTIAGRVTGRLLALNADVTFRQGSRVEGDVTVVGGVVEGRHDAYIGGELRIYRQALYYRQEGDRLVALRGRGEEDEGEWIGFGRRERRSWAGLTLSTGKTYNRVEGLPVLFGPRFEQELGWGRLRVDAYGIFRTAGEFKVDSANVGHLARAELRIGRGRGVRIGGRLYDEVAPVEDWQLGEAETGLATFFLHRDFRDYYGRQGGTGYVVLRASNDVGLTLSLADQRWSTRQVRDPFTLFRDRDEWRPNPSVDEGRFHVGTATLRIDTRNDEDNPWAGWYFVADYERGTGGVTRPGVRARLSTLPPPAEGQSELAPVLGTAQRVSYGRGFVDLRRYNRLSPDAQLNMRIVAGGWLHGDALPLQRRLSVTGPGAIPGYDFRRPAGTGAAFDVGQCAPTDVAGGTLAPLGTPAECDRVLMGQVEYRGDIRVGLFGDDDIEDERRWRRGGFRTDASWVVFADAGRGWLVARDGQRPDGSLLYGSGRVPSLGSFLTDVGVGLDFGNGKRGDVGSIGVYVAKSLTRRDQPANVFVRVRRRF